MTTKRDDAILVGQSAGKSSWMPGTPYVEGSVVWVAPDKAYAMVSPKFFKALQTPAKRKKRLTSSSRATA